jgi:LacI family transcriptional regulator, galactose operon repressor
MSDCRTLRSVRYPQGEGRAPTIRQVANEAGVSPSTVSRAFSRPEMLLPSTVTLILEVAERPGYQPNPTARALSTGRPGTVAIVVPDIANPFFPPLIRGVQTRADEVGYSVLLGDSDEDPDKEVVLVGKLAARTEGSILASSRMSEATIREHASRHPIVLVNRDIAGLPRVLIDTASGVAEGVSHLADLGHKSVAYVSGPSSSWSNQQRRSAARARARRLGVKLTVVPARRPTYAAGTAVAEKLLDAGATAALTFDDLLAQGLLAGLAERGVAVPDDFSIIGCDDVLAATTHPPLTTVSAQGGDAGIGAVDLLLATIRDEARSGDLRVVIPTSLVKRATTGRPGKSASAVK